jgi:hypothetical protein
MTTVQKLTITARSLESADALFVALSRFHPEMIDGENGSHSVTIALGSDSDIIAALNAIEQYVTARSDGPARLELDGHIYTMQPEPVDD